MLTLKNITKSYGEGENEVKALKGISISFRKSEFVSILGQSGCGKTTLLNIVGGLDRATSGELLLNGKSTDGFNQNDWDDYRNTKIGFVFQNYNLIPHLNILTNVELALTISGVKSSERTARAKEALAMVGLQNKWNKRPNQLSGGQMQRVAIARAIVNEPEILLADEPTGAIDSDTSIQIMNILKEISKTRLVIMVTHNAELAEMYSTRVVKFLDGEIIDDTMPYDENEEERPVAPIPQKKNKHKKGATMSFWTSVKLSWKNLINKKGRSLLTAVAGSIGIISIALILALNNGFTEYIGDFERQSMSKYPITVSSGEDSVISAFEEFLGGDDLDGDSLNISSVLDVLTGDAIDREAFTEEEIVYIYGQFAQFFNNSDITKTTEISKFKKHIEENFDYSLANVKYDYSISMKIFDKVVKKDSETGEETVSYTLLNPLSEADTLSTLLTAMSGGSSGGNDTDSNRDQLKIALNSFAFWDEIVADTETINAQYDVLSGHLPENMYEVVLVVDEYNQITDFDALTLNEMGVNTLFQSFWDATILNKYDMDFDEVIGKEFYILPLSAEYAKNEFTGLYDNVKTNGTLNTAIEENGITVKISGIVRPKEGINGGCINGVIGYTSDLGSYIISDANESELVQKFRENYDAYLADVEIANNALKKAEEDPEYQMTPEESKASMSVAFGIKSPVTGKGIKITDYSNTLKNLNVRDLDSPSYIYFYPNRIADKQEIVKFINDFNTAQQQLEDEEAKIAEENGETASSVTYVIEYEDNLDSVVSELNSVVDTITYILVAVACVSVIVTMLLIAIIMYISVQDRTREIGIMRAIGARKRDISNIFNVETLLLGLASGIIGALIAYIVQFPGNLIFTEALNMAALLQMAWWHPIVLIVGAIIITVVSGLIPAAMAAKKEPVIALRTE